jgi:hypothetical protein
VSETKRRGVRPLWEQEATWCVHFTGMANNTCRLGIAYDDVFNREGAGIGNRFPCLKAEPADRTRTDMCPSVEYLTEEQAKAKAKEIHQRLAEKLMRMADGHCPECDQQVEGKRQVGRCIYALPCNHRLGQGRLR